MKKMMQKVSNFWYDEAGATAVEYGLMVALIAAAIVIVVGNLGTGVEAAFQAIVDVLPAA